MDVKGTLKAVTLELRHELDGRYDAQGTWHPGDLERRLASIGVWPDREPKPLDELPRLVPDDREARRVVDAFLESRREAGRSREDAIAEFVRDAAYTWANRLLALRCMEARGLIDEVILQKDAYGGRSLQHNRLTKKQPERCAGEDEGLFAALFDEFARRAEELPLLFNPRAPEVALRPSVAALKHCISILSGTNAVKGQEAATDQIFTAPDALGWTYQYWNTEEKSRVFEKVRTKKGSKIEGAEIIAATCIYTEPYMVKFLVQNSLGAMWMGMSPDSRLTDRWEYFVHGADRAPVSKKPVAEITFLDPACGSGHFLIEAFDLLYEMYVEEGVLTEPAEICASILERNLYGIDIDERAIQIAVLALVMKAKEKAEGFVPRQVNLVATYIRLPSGREHLEAFLQKYPEDVPLEPALLAIFDGLAHADELGSLLQIEGPVEMELLALKEDYEAAGSPMEQQALWREFQKPTQGKLPIGVATYEAWNKRTLARLREHFDVESRATDLGTAFFGDAACRGLSLVDLLLRRYDVVSANPPYMGSKSMGPVLKTFLERHFAAGKRDVYAAFILRCLELAADGGRVAMVTQQSWMFLRSFASLRAENTAACQPSGKRRFRGLLWDSSFEVLAHLGAGAFADVGGEVVKSVLFVLSNTSSEAEHRVVIIAPNARTTSVEKDCELRARRTAQLHLQSSFRTTSDSIISYWVPPELWITIPKNRRLSSIAKARKGITTMANSRFVRWVWETPASRRWKRLTKSLPFLRWRAPQTHSVEWDFDGARVKTFVAEGYGGGGWSRAIANAELYFERGCWCSIVCGGNPSFRSLESSVFETKVIAVIPSHFNTIGSLLAYLNTGLVTYLLRAMSPGLETLPGAVESLPVPERLDGFDSPDSAGEYERLSGLSERSLPYGIALDTGAKTLLESFRQHFREASATAAGVLCVEAQNESEAYRVMDISNTTRRVIEADVGRAVGHFPLVRGYDAPLAGVALPSRTAQWLDRHERVDLDVQALASIRSRLASLYCALDRTRAGGGFEDIEAEAEGEEADREPDGAYNPRPSETAVEAFSMELRVHPVSTHRLLEDEIARSALRSPIEEQRFVADKFSGIVLRLLGHRWPGEVEPTESPPPEPANDNIIPIVGGLTQPSLYRRIQESLGSEYQGNSLAIEREFEDILGISLREWLATEFFSRHVAQFKKRPIAWQIESTPGGNAKRGGRRGERGGPVFSCLVYYHSLDMDLLPKLRTHYIGPLRASLQTELVSLERMRDRSADQDARRLELEAKLEELKNFHARLEEVISFGFASPILDEVAAKEPLDKWTARDVLARVPETGDVLLAQERRYIPDLNDGIRVNVAPLQRAGLLAADVLSTKDIEKAIADRAEWRADERRWCREGKLPQPGWWPVAAKAIDVPAIPDALPAMDAAQEAMLFVWALLHAAGGSIPRVDVARAFALRCRPSLLRRFAPSDARQKASEWADLVGQRSIAAGLLASVLSDLASRDIVRLTTDEASRSVVKIGPQMPAEDEVDAWFRFEARLALRVFWSLQPAQVQEIERGITGDDRKLLAAEVA